MSKAAQERRYRSCGKLPTVLRTNGNSLAENRRRCCAQTETVLRKTVGGVAHKRERLCATPPASPRTGMKNPVTGRNRQHVSDRKDYFRILKRAKRNRSCFVPVCWNSTVAFVFSPVPSICLTSPRPKRSCSIRSPTLSCPAAELPPDAAA